MQDAATAHLNAGLVRQLLDTHGHVVLALVEQALFELTGADDIAVATDERRRGGLEHDGESRRVDLDGIELDGVLRIVYTSPISVLSHPQRPRGRRH
ncbi:MAG: hypothetical protein ACLVKA_11290 [Collinsella aerofaciens]